MSDQTMTHIDRYLPASGSDDARLQAAYAEGRKDERETLSSPPQPMNDTQRRVSVVLARIAASCAADEYIAEIYSDMLESMLDIMANEDAFGTQNQDDPRGDGRNNVWSMNYVEGVDDQ